jgi:cellulose synthase (UDP-forming)
MAWRSPADGKRVVTALFASNAPNLPLLLERMSDPQTGYLVQGDVALLGGEGFNSTRVNPGFWSGDLPLHIRAFWWLSGNPVLLGVLAVGASLLMGGAAFTFLKARERRRLREIGER